MAKRNSKTNFRKSSNAVADAVENKESMGNLAKENETTSETSEITEPIDVDSLPSFEKDEPVVEIVEETDAGVTFESSDAPKEVSDEELQKNISSFNRSVLGQIWKSKQMLKEKAQIELGADVETYQGNNQNEVFFKIKGIRVPSEGVYHIRVY